MNFRKQILLVFFLFGFVPLFFLVAVNLPLVLDKIETFFYQGHLVNLRADFRDLDQHVASRYEVTRLLARLPEPGSVLGEREGTPEEDIDLARARYTAWINGVLGGSEDITQIIFYNRSGETRFWLERDAELDGWIPTTRLIAEASPNLIRQGMNTPDKGVLVSRLVLDPEGGRDDPSRLMTLWLVSPILLPEYDQPVGAVAVNVDVSGMARGYGDRTFWVRDTGEFLDYGDPNAPSGPAESLFPGVAETFAAKKAALWSAGGQRAIWAPLFVTENDAPLWVGRRVDDRELDEFRDQLNLRVLGIALLMVVVILLVARWFADRADLLSRELSEGIRKVVQEGESVQFDWNGPRELRELGADLTRLAQQHAGNIAELQQRARELEQTNRYKSQFLANVSHELRTPLNSILLLSRLMASEQTDLAPELREQARVIHHAGSDLRSLIDNILDLSRNEAGKTQFNLDWFNPADVLEEIRRLLQPQFDERSLPLILKVEETAPQRIYSDQEKMGQIIKNFLSNAAKFTSEGEVRIRLGEMKEQEDCSDCRVYIEVSDTGIGIPAAKQEHIFDAFRQADESTSRRYGGTGLGLAISRQLARLLGGEIILKSREGEGAVFRLLLPLEFDRDAVDEDQWSGSRVAGVVEEVSSASEVTADFVGCSVLLMDDDVASLLSLTPLLEAWGMSVHAAGDCDEATEIIEEEERIDLVLLDLVMPSDGACDTIKALKMKNDQLVVLAMAFSARAVSDHGACEALIDRVILKPVDPDELQNILRDLMVALPSSA